MYPNVMDNAWQTWKLRMEIKRLQQWVDDLLSGDYVNCVYCGHRYGPDNGETPLSKADILKEHIEQCPQHPMSELKRQNASLSSELASLKYLSDLDHRLATEEIRRLEYLHDLDHKLADKWQKQVDILTDDASKALKAQALHYEENGICPVCQSTESHAVDCFIGRLELKNQQLHHRLGGCLGVMSWIPGAKGTLAFKRGLTLYDLDTDVLEGEV